MQQSGQIRATLTRNSRSRIWPGLTCLLLLLTLPCAARSGEWPLPDGAGTGSPEGAVRRVIQLNGSWQVDHDGTGPHSIEVPSSLEDALQTDFDGISVWERNVPAVSLEPDERLVLCFDAVATRATVSLAGEPVGSHLGGWTPFEFDVTAIARQHSGDDSWLLRVEVDELVGHNTQGFLPVVTLHFGGIWQGVRMEVRGPVAIGRGQALVRGDADGWLHLDIPVIDHRTARGALSADVAFRRFFESSGEEDPYVPAWNEIGRVEVVANETAPPAHSGFRQDDVSRLAGRLRADGFSHWSPSDPAMYEVRIRVCADGGDGAKPLDEAVFLTGFSTASADGTRLLLNGRPLTVRGVLNWGYAPPRIAPAVDEAAMRAEIHAAREHGFNLMKFCLWIPPRRYFELCDELGMLAWVEYPTWHPRLDEQHRADLLREYGELFALDRNHPSVVLRSLTCETGPSADLNVIRSLYDMGKHMIPGALIEDDSSWIEWNRIHDFYDDHPYGNNHDWPATLDRLRQFIAGREPKPLVLGEAIAADTWSLADPWADSNGFLQAAHRSWSIDARRKWLERMQEISGRFGRFVHPQSLEVDSLLYAQSMREYQIETFRRMMPDAGYVVSVIRDFPKARMGLIDAAGRTKFDPRHLKRFGDRALLLERPGERQAVAAGQQARFAVRIAGLDPDIPPEAKLEIGLFDMRNQQVTRSEVPLAGLQPLEPGGHPGGRFLVEMPGDGGKFQFWQPMRLRIRTSGLNEDLEQVWTIWSVPQAPWPKSGAAVAPELRENLAGADFSGLPDLAVDQPLEQLWIVRRFSPEVLDRLERGGKVLLLPDGGPGSFPLAPHWFLRGGPAWFPSKANQDGETSIGFSKGNLSMALPLVMLQHFDLAGLVVPRIDGWLDRINPRLVLWDDHDLRECRTHGLWFELPVGNQGGWLTVSALNHGGEGNAAGAWWLRGIAQMASVSPEANAGQHAELGQQNLELLRQNLGRRELALESCEWRFRPDPGAAGIAAHWERPLDDQAGNGDRASWTPIRTGAHWEGQGFDSLDGWGWYRTRLEIPAGWPAATGFLTFTGVDDCARVFVNGELAGRLGNDDPRESAFDLQQSLDIGRWIQPGQAIELVIAVYDWQGAGGLFRPIHLTTEPIEGRIDLIRPAPSLSP